MAQTTHKNHFLPELYLKAWTTCEPKGTEKKLWAHFIHERGGLRHPRVTTGRVGYVVDYLTETLDGADGQEFESDAIEIAFSKEIDGPAVHALDKLKSLTELSKDDASVLLRFLLSIYSRNPEIGPSLEATEAQFQRIVRKAARANGIKGADAEWWSPKREARSAIVHSALDLAKEAEDFQHFLDDDAPWMVLDCSDGELYTCDMPISTMSRSRPPSWIAFAISPLQMLVLGVPPTDPHDHRELMAWYNLGLVARAVHSPGTRIYSCRDADPFSLVVQESRYSQFKDTVASIKGALARWGSPWGP